MGAWETVTAWVAVNLTVLAFLPCAQAQPSAARKQASYTHNVGIDNQSEIGTRAPPFAGYIEAMHRQIHRFWGDSCPAAPERPSNQGQHALNLVTALEISLKPDGTVNQVIVRGPSGVIAFDGAAVKAVQMAAPFPTPPQAIKSRDGNVYVTWLFHRDDKQCASEFVSEHILSAAAKPAPAAVATTRPSSTVGSSAAPTASVKDSRWAVLLDKQRQLRDVLGQFGDGNIAVHSWAAYIAAMHRQIHKFWGDGFLAALDHQKSLEQYPMNLVTALEISLKPDGRVNQIIISRPSGSLPFDVAAMESVQGAAPFPPPPQVIKSRDSNVYMTWLFHRDDRQCATDFVTPHVLTTPARPSPPAAAPTAALTSSSLTAAGNTPPTAITQNRPAAAVLDNARAAAERWLNGYRRADVRWLTGSSALPFTAGGKTVAEDASGLRSFYEELLAEGTPKQDRVHFYTPEQIKQRRGSLPRGGDEDDMVFAWVELGGEDLILILQPASNGWRVVGIDR